MRYDKEFSLSDIFTNEKYKARAILLFFALIILILIILARTTPKNDNGTKSNNNTSNNTNVNDNTTLPNNNGSTENTGILYNRFSFLRLNNYEFLFTIDTNKKIVINGQRFDNKFKMTVKSEEESYEYQMRDNVAKAIINDKLTTVSTPTVLINYFDNNTLYSIIYYSDLVEETQNTIEYKITNDKLAKVLSKQINIAISEDKKELTNKIVVDLNNNKINHINFDFNNFVDNVHEVEKLIIDLKYDKVGQIDDFELDF